MKITICSSLDFVSEIKEISEKLTALGHIVLLPMTAELILKGEIKKERIKEEKENGTFADRSIKSNSIKIHLEKIRDSEAILALNLEKKGIKNYIGGAVFMEMGFAYGLEKKIFLLNPIPQMPYTEEIVAMEPVILHGNLSKIHEFGV